jgi:UDP-2,3-diacylglucosamine hydrolase
MSILLLSDLHLPNEASPLRSAFARFLTGPARQATAVYLLGDLFEYWIGDDVGLRDYAEEVSELRMLRHHGAHIFFMHGNRDFLVGHRFATAAGVELVADPLKIDLAGTPTLLSHGDIFCTDDHAYQRWRRISRNKFGQSLFHLLPESRRLSIAGNVRSRNQVVKRNKPDAIMDVNEGSVRDAFRRHQVSRIIHGHTHRPAEHAYNIDGRACQRIVLADWRPERLEYLHCDEQGWRRETVTA